MDEGNPFVGNYGIQKSEVVSICKEIGCTYTDFIGNQSIQDQVVQKRIDNILSQIDNTQSPALQLRQFYALWSTGLEMRSGGY